MYFKKKQFYYGDFKKGEKGIKFYWKGKYFFHPYRLKRDTICKNKFKYQFVKGVKEYQQKKVNWINKKFKGSKYKPYGGLDKGVFIGYIVEDYKEKYYIIYPIAFPNFITSH